MSAQRSWICHFSDPYLEAAAGAESLLGRKGEGLRRMVQSGFDVPAGFIIITEACREYFELGRSLPSSLWPQVVEGVERLERETGLGFGDCSRPLLLAVRSGAPASMPGVLDTLLNCGLTDSLAASDDRQRDYARFIEAFAASDGETYLDETPESELPQRQADLCELRLAQYERLAGEPFPQNSWEQLRRCICAVMDSWRRPRAVHYRRALGLAEGPGTAVVVQAMFPCEISGVLFTSDSTFEFGRSGSSSRSRTTSRTRENPRTLGDRPAVGAPTSRARLPGPNLETRSALGELTDSRMVVEAVEGLGEELVSGRTTPQRFFIPRNDRTPPTDRAQGTTATVSDMLTGSARPALPGEPQSEDGGGADALLTPEQLRLLRDLGLRLETEFGAAVDVEWGWADNRFAILQTRLIQNLPQTPCSNEALTAEITRLKQRACGRQTLWVRHNLAESLPSPTPLTWDIVCQLMSGEGGYGKLYRDLGYSPATVVCRHGFLELVCGRVYADTERLAQLLGAGLPLRFDPDAVREDPSLIERAPTVFDPRLTNGWFLLQLPRIAWVLWRARRRIKRASHDAARRFDEEILPEFLAYVERERSRKLADCDWDALVDLLQRRIDRVLTRFAAESLLPGLLGSLAFASLERQLAQLIGLTEGPALARRLITGLDSDPEIDQEAWLARVASGQVSVDEFLARFGHRTTGEMELATPRWREDRQALQQLVQWVRTAAPREPEQRRADARIAHQDAVADLHRRLQDEGASSFLIRLECDLSCASQLIPYREIGKHYLMMGYELIRHVIEELARRSDIGADIYFLRFDEIARLPEDKGRLLERSARRRKQRIELNRIVVPDVVDPCQLDSLVEIPGFEPNEFDQLWRQGTPLSSGTASGPALIVRAPNSVAAPTAPGYVLVCPAIDPGFTPLLLGASALVVELGGLLSHGAVVARQFGIPAVACPRITQLARPSATILVDGDSGRVRLG